MELATQDEATMLWTDRGNLPAERALQLAKEMGATWIRFIIYSSYVKQLGWGQYDAAIARCQVAGLHVQLVVAGQMRDHVGSMPDGGVPYVDPSPAAFAEFCEHVVRRYPTVRRFSFGNEPNHPAFLKVTRGSTAEHYGEMYRAAYTRVRKFDHTAQILFAELSGGKGAQAFLRRAIGGRVTYASGLAIHPYQYLTNPSKPDPGDNYQWGHVPALRDHLKAYAVDRLMTRDGEPLPIYVTEMGWFAAGAKRAIPEGRRADYAAATIRQARALGVREFLYYHLVEHLGDGWNTGIVRPDGTPTPTFNAIKAAFAAS